MKQECLSLFPHRRSSQKGHSKHSDRDQGPRIQIECPENEEEEEQEERPVIHDRQRRLIRGRSRSRDQPEPEEDEEEIEASLEEGYQSDSETSDDDDESIPFMRNTDLFVGGMYCKTCQLLSFYYFIRSSFLS